MSTDESIRFNLHLDMGNDAMRTPADIADALRRAATLIETRAGLWDLALYQNIKDQNGNSIGQYAVKNQAGDTPAMHSLNAIERGE